jgi:hypothetical protein
VLDRQQRGHLLLGSPASHPSHQQGERRRLPSCRHANPAVVTRAQKLHEFFVFGGRACFAGVKSGFAQLTGKQQLIFDVHISLQFGFFFGA